MIRKDRDRLILVFHVNTCGLSEAKGKQLLCVLNNHFHEYFDDSVKCLILPLNNPNEPSYKVECINPKFISKSDGEEVKVQLDRIENKYIELFSDDMG